MSDEGLFDKTAPGAPPPRAGGVQAGELLAGRYRLVRFIAAGGMGEVWEAEDTALHERVALKTIHHRALGPEATARFHSEVKLSRRVTHRNVCRVFEFGEHPRPGGEPVAFFTMELLTGTSLDDELRRRGRFSLPEALPLLGQMAGALDAAHAEGILHRDFKAQNVFLQAEASGLRVVVTDFGIARSIAAEQRITADPTQLLGTPAYMAPEQVEGRDAGPATDVFSLGVVAFELLTGQLPFTGDSALAVALQRLREPPRSARALAPELSETTERALAVALAREPAQRFPSASAFIEALSGHPSALPAPPRRRRGPWLLAATAVVGLAVAALTLRPSPGAGVASSPAAPGPSRGGVLRLGASLGGQWALVPRAFSTESVLSNSVVEPLLGTPGVATLEPADAGGLEWSLALQPGVVFQPHPCLDGGLGRPADAEDLLVSLREAPGLGVGMVGLAGGQPWALTRAGQRVTLRLAAINPHLEELLEAVPLFPRELLGCEDLGALRHPVGTGALRVRSASPGTVVLEGFEGARRRGEDGAPLPYLSRVEVWNGTDGPSLLERLGRGELDAVELELPRDYALLERGPANEWRLAPPFARLPVTVAPVANSGTMGVRWLNVFPREGGALQSTLVRRAVALAIDRAALLTLEADPRRFVPVGRMLDGRFAGRDLSIRELGLDLEAARRLLAEAGHPGGLGLPEVMLGHAATRRAWAVRICEDLRGLGLKARPVVLEPQELERAAREGAVDAWVGGFQVMADTVEPWPFLVDVVSQAQANGWRDQKSAELVRLNSAEPDLRVRLKRYAELESHLLEQLPFIPLLVEPTEYPNRLLVMSARVRGLVDPVGGRLKPPQRRFIEAWVDPPDGGRPP